MSSRTDIIDKIALIYIKDKKMLNTRSKGNDMYYFPGGKREGNETDEQTLIREILEELSTNIITDTIQYYGTFEAQAHGKPEGTIVRTTCYTAEFEGIEKPSAEIEELVWLEYKDIEKISLVGKLVLEDLYSKNLIK